MSVVFVKFNYCVEGLCKFLSHKSRTRLIKLALRRCSVPVKYSEGYSPRISLIYCPPSPVGISVERDFFILECLRPSPVQNIIECMNKVLPEGFRITYSAVCSIQDASLFRKADLIAVYKIRFLEEQRELHERIKDFLSLKDILLKRKGKKDKDVRPLVKEIYYSRRGEENTVDAYLYAGPSRYLSPLDFLELLLEKQKMTFYHYTQIIREGFMLIGTDHYV